MPIDPSIPLSVQPFRLPSPMQTLGQMGQLRAQQEASEIRQMQMEEARRRQAAEQQQTEAAGARTAAMRLPRAQALKSLEGDPEGYALATKQFAAIDAVWNQMLGEAAAGVRAFKDSPGAAIAALDDLIEKGFDERKLEPLRARIQQQPELVTQLVDSLLTNSPVEAHRALVTKPAPVPTDYNLGQQRFSGATNQPIATAAPTPEKPPALGSEADFIARYAAQRRLKPEQLSPKDIENARRAYEASGRAPQQPDYEWVTRDGKPLQIRKGTAQPGDAPYRAGISLDEGMESPYQNALNRAIMSIPAIRRGSVVQHANRLWQEGNTAELKDVIRQAAVESEPVDTRNQVMGRMATIASLADTRAILNELKAAGVPTGWLTGNVEDLARRLGKTTDPRYVELGTRLMGTLINYRRAATGVQFSARESADYQKMFPNYRNELPVNLALIDGLMREMTTYDTAYWTHKLGKDGASLVGVITADDAPSDGGTPGGVPSYQDYLRSRQGGR